MLIALLVLIACLLAGFAVVLFLLWLPGKFKRGVPDKPNPLDVQRMPSIGWEVATIGWDIAIDADRHVLILRDRKGKIYDLTSDETRIETIEKLIGAVRESSKQETLMPSGVRAKRQYSIFLQFEAQIKSGKKAIIFAPDYVVITRKIWKDIESKLYADKRKIIIDDPIVDFADESESITEEQWNKLIKNKMPEPPPNEDFKEYSK